MCTATLDLQECSVQNPECIHRCVLINQSVRSWRVTHCGPIPFFQNPSHSPVDNTFLSWKAGTCFLARTKQAYAEGRMGSPVICWEWGFGSGKQNQTKKYQSDAHLLWKHAISPLLSQCRQDRTLVQNPSHLILCKRFSFNVKTQSKHRLTRPLGCT